MRNLDWARAGQYRVLTENICITQDKKVLDSCEENRTEDTRVL